LLLWCIVGLNECWKCRSPTRETLKHDICQYIFKVQSDFDLNSSL